MTEQAAPRVHQLAVVGAGLMGSGIAQTAIQQGMDVLLFDAKPGLASSSREAALSRISTQVDRGRVAAESVEDAASRLVAVDALEDLSSADAVIEAVIEDLQVKQELFSDLEKALPRDALLATNTSALPITQIASGLEDPSRLVGMHFFSPVPATRLCEIVRGLLTADEAVARAEALADGLGKESIVVQRDDAGFVTSRLMTVLGQEAVRIVEEGLASAEEVDRACELAFGHRMGPLATLDLTGLDVAQRAGDGIYRETADPRYAPPQLLRRMVSAGLLGRKSGRGFFRYDKGDGR